MVDTSYVDADNRRTWNSLIYSRFLVIGFHKGVDSYQIIVKSVFRIGAYQKQHQ